MNRLGFALSVLMLFSSVGFSQQELQLSPTLEGGVIRLNLVDTNLEFNYWRIESCRNDGDWIPYASAEVYTGTGSCSIALADFSQTRLVKVRAVLDSSEQNVLDVPEVAIPYSGIVLPVHLSGPEVLAEDNTPPENPITDDGATLGRVLFYDKGLSANYTISCSSCHQQANGFSDPNQFSIGFEGGFTGRNSMGLSNAQFYERGHFFWDERADTLEDQVLRPIQDAVEMGMTLTGMVRRVESYEYYETLFTAAFGDSTVTTNRIAAALAQFVRSMVSFQSKFDEGSDPAVNFSNFTAQEVQGQQIFNGPRGNCAACHSGPNFVGVRISNNGLELPFVDPGVGGVTGRANDMGKFKMSSLRNIELTAPYMHDGRHATLEDVVEHYSTGVVDNVNLGPQLRGPPPGPDQPPPPLVQKNFTAQEKAALVAFMKTLTDPVLVVDPKYSDPFLPAPELTWIGNSFNAPANGTITDSDDVWINTDAFPLGASAAGIVRYTTNAWVSSSDISLRMSQPIGNNDRWSVNLGTFPSGTEIEFAVRLIDYTGHEIWDNNGGSNFRAQVNAP